jgi:hypothetical protein
VDFLAVLAVRVTFWPMRRTAPIAPMIATIIGPANPASSPTATDEIIDEIFISAP